MLRNFWHWTKKIFQEFFPKYLLCSSMRILRYLFLFIGDSTTDLKVDLSEESSSLIDPHNAPTL